MIERTSQVLNKSDTARVLTERSDYALDEMRANIKSHGSDDEFNQSFDDYVDWRTKAEELNTEFAAVLQLDMLYFEGETRDAAEQLRSLGKKWFDADDDQKETLLRAMHSELWLGIENPPAYSTK